MSSAVEEFKRQLAEWPTVPGGVVAPMFRWERGVVPSDFVKLIAEVVERLEALEAAPAGTSIRELTDAVRNEMAKDARRGVK